ncbi:MAG: hypothetical protein GY762_01255 [Proteobacteria bacterium]|nr:hypothetical protein [Pseudomonadota bacterium]
MIGTVGADITLDGLSVYLDQKKVGRRGRIFVLDGSGNVIVRSGGDASQPALSQDRLDAVAITNVVKHFKDTGEEKFTLPGAIPIMASFKPFPDEFQKPWVIGVIADRDEFIYEIKQTTLRVLAAASVVACLAVVSISLLSKRLTRSLRQVIEEMKRIQDFRLDDAFSLRSSIIEINDLVSAVKRMKNSLRSFGAYVPIDLVRTIVSSGTAVRVGGQQRELTLMFSDIESFTKNSEKMRPGGVFADLSAYFTAMTDAIRLHDGTVDKFIGDAVMAFWNAPKEDPDHAAAACRATLACLDACKQLNVSNSAVDRDALFPVTTRFALHCGDVMVGNVGSDERMQYTALGATVNLASRIEAINKRYGTYLLITESVAEKVSGRFLMRAIDIVAPAGVSFPITIYELLGEIGEETEFPATQMQKRMCDTWRACMAIYEARNWEQAAAGFRRFIDDYPEDKPAKHYLARCEEFICRSPPPDWNGVTNYDSKLV